MYIYINMCIYIYIYIYILTDSYIYIYIFIHMFIHTNAYVYDAFRAINKQSVASLRQGNTEADNDMSSLDWQVFLSFFFD